MSSEREQALYSIYRLRADYPGGIPKALLESDRSPKAGTNKQPGFPRVAFVLGSDSQKEKDSTESFIEAIVSKGMRLTMADVIVRYVPGSGTSEPAAIPHVVFGEEALNSLLGADKASQCELGSWKTISGMVLMPTYDLKSVATDKEVKKRFWAHLQEVMKRLPL